MTTHNKPKNLKPDLVTSYIMGVSPINVNGRLICDEKTGPNYSD